jgi:large subunit ribosomal protein L30
MDSTMAKIKVTQIRSIIDRPERQKRTIRALGITKMNQSVVHEATPQVQGMIEKVKHLVKVEEA